MASSKGKTHAKSPEWQATKDDYWRLFGRRCQACNATGVHLVIHHMHYRGYGRERMSDLKSLCDRCHGATHSAHKRAGGSLRRVTEGICGFVALLGTIHPGYVSHATARELADDYLRSAGS